MKPFDRTKHIELWQWLAKNPGKGKEQWPGWEKYKDEEYPANGCYACQYQLDAMEKDNKDFVINETACNIYCPLIWPEGKTCTVRDGLFYKLGTGNDDVDADLCLKIANLPVREGVKTI